MGDYVIVIAACITALSAIAAACIQARATIRATRLKAAVGDGAAD